MIVAVLLLLTQPLEAADSNATSAAAVLVDCVKPEDDADVAFCERLVAARELEVAARDAFEAARENECADPPTQLAMNFCASENFEKADAELNELWAVAAAKMRQMDERTSPHNDGRPGYYEALLEAQRAWLVFRDTNCRVEGYKLRGGSAESMEVSGCKAIMTRQRTEELRELIETY